MTVFHLSVTWVSNELNYHNIPPTVLLSVPAVPTRVTRPCAGPGGSPRRGRGRRRGCRSGTATWPACSAPHRNGRTRPGRSPDGGHATFNRLIPSAFCLEKFMSLFRWQSFRRITVTILKVHLPKVFFEQSFCYTIWQLFKFYPKC